MEDYDRVLESSHKQVLSKAEKKVKAVYPDLKAKQLLARGHIPTTIIETAESEDVDLFQEKKRVYLSLLCDSVYLLCASRASPQFVAGTSGLIFL
jgi:hypothetical protein